MLFFLPLPTSDPLAAKQTNNMLHTQTYLQLIPCSRAKERDIKHFLKRVLCLIFCVFSLVVDLFSCKYFSSCLEFLFCKMLLVICFVLLFLWKVLSFTLFHTLQKWLAFNCTNSSVTCCFVSNATDALMMSHPYVQLFNSTQISHGNILRRRG